MPIPPDTRAPGDDHHVDDHNAISDELTALVAADTAETARAQAAEKLALTVFNVRSYGATGNGTTDDTAAFNAAISAASAGGVIYMPPGTYLLSSVLAPVTPGLIFQGAGSALGVTTGTLLVNNTSDVFTGMSGNAGPTGLIFRDFAVTATAGHIFTFPATGNASGWEWSRLYLAQSATGKSIINVPGGAFDSCHVHDCFSQAVNAAVPAYNLVSTGNSVLDSTFENMRHIGTGATAEILHIENNSSAYSYGMTVRSWVMEQCGGGLIKLLSCFSAHIEDISLHDLAGATTADCIFVGKSASGPKSNGIRIIRSSRVASNTLGAGLADINLDNAAAVRVEDCNTSIGSGFTVNVNFQSATIIAGMPAATIQNQGTDTILLNSGGGYGINPGSGNGGGTGGSVMAGSAAPSTSMGAVGDLYIRNGTPSTAGQVLYVKTGASAWTALLPSSGTPLALAQGGTGQGSQAAALTALAGTQSAGKVLRSDGTNTALANLQAADLPGATTSAQGAVQLDGTAGDIKAPGLTAAVGASGKVPDASHVHPLQDPLMLGTAATFVPSGNMSNGAVTANSGWYYRLLAGGIACTVIQISVGTSSGNISVAAYQNSGSGATAKPAAQIQTSGSVACPAAGAADVILGSSITPNINDWLAIGVDNATATFAGTGGVTTGLTTACAYEQTGLTGAVLPSPAGTLANTVTRYVYMRGH